MTTKRLTRDTAVSVLGGVCAGLARYWNLDPVLVRVLAVVVLVFSGFFPIVLIYLLAWIIMPRAAVTYTVVD